MDAVVLTREMLFPQERSPVTLIVGYNAFYVTIVVLMHRNESTLTMIKVLIYIHLTINDTIP